MSEQQGSDNNNYSLKTSASFIHEAVGADKHRLDVSRYLGSAERPGILNQLFEFIDNAIDECVETHTRLKALATEKLGADKAKEVPPCHVVVRIHTNDEVEVMDTGRGVPCEGINGGEPAIYKVYESDSAGGKGGHAQGGYTSGTAGQHGAGAAVAKSCTEYFNVVTTTVGQSLEGTGTFMLGYTRGRRTSPLQKSTEELQLSESPLLAQLGVYRTGTWIRYKYDESLFRCKENGMDVDAYDKQQIVSRLKPILLGLKDRDSLRITLVFKDQQPEIIDPNEYTPELFLEATGPVHKFSISSEKKEARNTFKADIYLTMGSTGFGFNGTTIVNRLLMTMSGTNKTVEDRIKDGLRKVLEAEFFLGNKFSKDERAIIEDNRLLASTVNEMMVRMKALVVMELGRAEFSGQTKSVLVNTDFMGEFKRLIGNHLVSGNGALFLRQYVDQALLIIQGKIRVKKIERKEQAKLEQARANSNKMKTEANKILNDPLAALQRKISLVAGTNETRFTYKASSFPTDQSYLMLVEGASASTALGNIIDLPITVIGMLGKPANVFSGKQYDPEQLSVLSVELQKPYMGLLLLTDADSDALHIRILLMALTWEQAPSYMTQGKMFIINSPHARIMNGNPNPVTINLKGVAITYPPGVSSLTKSPTETELALQQKGVYLNEKYGGLADCLTDGEGDIELIDLVQDPNYRSQLDPPTQYEIEFLRQMLQESGELKQNFTSKICTNRLNYARWMFDVGGTKVPRLDLFSQVYRANPVVEGHQLYYIHVGNA